MIEFDESEKYNSPVTNRVLRLVRLFNDQETGDMLLYRGDTPLLNCSKSSTKPSQMA